ncbi:MAG: SpoIIE family protein phosphatase, partial [Spirochaetia bacterium]|nr:SpoIIE family protein phosphatase [Spirochaetia bacterium]
SIRSARQKLERYADELEDKVRERTAELTETLKTVQKLKTQQDGDYFLTSLLIKPLTRNATRSETIHVDFLIEQKKKFEFRHWKEEIGGDFCSAHAITLRGKPHTVFVNADAMGKSMQGAGGALVLGAVFESLMKRTKTIPMLQNHSPERWLKNAFQELQSVFESFDGSMLVSMVLGIIDDETGLMYYVNVEHPWTVLYRNGKASFIEKEQTFRKLGVSGMRGRIVISTYQMQPQDVLIVGSDGRDDLVVGTQPSGERIINEDENLFLRAVEAADAVLGNIRSHLEEFGALTDDLSLIRIAYRGERGGTVADQREEIVKLRKDARALVQESKFEEAAEVLNQALRIEPASLKTIRMLVQTYVQQKDYEKAFDRIEDYIYLRPLDTEIIYLASHLCGKLGRLQDAAEFGERVRLRSPDFVRNLLNLADVYLLLGNQSRAEKLLDEAAAIEPANPKLLKLRGIAAKTITRSSARTDVG